MQCAASPANADSGVGGRCKAAQRVPTTSGARRRAWSNHRSCPVHRQQVHSWPWGAPLTRCRATATPQLSAAVEHVVSVISEGRKQPQEVLEAAMALPPQDLIDIAWQLIKSDVPTTASLHSSKVADGYTHNPPASAKLTARQLLLVVEARDELYQLGQDPLLLRQLCRVLHEVNQTAALDSRQGGMQQSEAWVSARLRWPRLLSWVCQQVLEQRGQLETSTSSAALQALASSSHPTHPQVLLALLQGLLGLASGSQHSAHTQQHDADDRLAELSGTSIKQSQQHEEQQQQQEDEQQQQQVQQSVQRGSQSALEVAEGLRALSQLHALQPPDQYDSSAPSELQACLEHVTLLAAFDQGSRSCPTVLAELAQTCTLFGCVPPPEFVTAVFTVASEAANSGPNSSTTTSINGTADMSVATSIHAAAGMLVPLAHLMPGGLDGLRHVMKHISISLSEAQASAATTPGPGSQALSDSNAGLLPLAQAFMSGLSAAEVRDSTTAAVVAEEALAWGHAGLVVEALQSMAHSPAARTACEDLSQWLSDRSHSLTLGQLCRTCTGIGHLQLEAAPGAQALLSLCQQQLQAHAAGQHSGKGNQTAPTSQELLALAHAFHRQLETQSAPAAVGLTASGKGSSTTSLALSALLALPPSLLGQGGITASADGNMQDVFPGCLEAIKSRHARQINAELLQTLSSEAGRQLAFAHPLQHACNWLLLEAAVHVGWLQPAELVALLKLVCRLPAGNRVAGTQHAEVAALLRVTSLAVWGLLDCLTTSQVCDVMSCFGKLNWRPGLLVSAMVESMHTALATVQSTMVSSSRGSMDETPAGLLTAREVTDVTRFCWALARLGHHTASARRLLRLATSATIAAHDAAITHLNIQPSFLSGPSQPDAPAAQSSGNQSGMAGSTRRSSGNLADGPGEPVSVEHLVTLLWCHAKLGAGGNAALLSVRGLVLAIMAHPSSCSLPQLARVWWSVGKLALSGARLTAWLVAATASELQRFVAGAGILDRSDSANVAGSGTLGRSANVHPRAANEEAAGGNSSQGVSRGKGVVGGAALAQLCWGMHKLDVRPSEQILGLLLDVSLQHVKHMRPVELTQVVYALIQWCQPPPAPAPLQARLGQLVRLAATRLEQQLPDFHTPGAVHLVGVLAKAGQPIAHSTLDSIASRLQRSEPCTGLAPNQPTAATATSQAPAATAHARLEAKHIDDELISQFFWACSVCGHEPTSLLHAYSNCLPVRLQRHYRGGRDARDSAAIVAAAVLGLGSCRFHHDGAIRALDDALCRYHQFFTGHQLSSCLFGLALLGHCPEQAWRKGLFSALRSRAPGMKLLELVHTLWALSQWPVEQVLGRQRLDLLREALRPVLLVHVLGARMSASAAYDAAGERTTPPPQPPPTGSQQPGFPGASLPAAQQAPGGAPLAAATAGAPSSQMLRGEQPGIPFGRLPASGSMPPDPTQLLMTQRPPLRTDAVADLAVGAATLGVCTPDVAEAIAGWAMAGPAGGLSRFSSRQLCALLWAFARCQHDRLSLFEGAAELLSARAFAAALGAELSGISMTAAGAEAAWVGETAVPPQQHRLTARDLQKLLWAWAKFNRHPGEELLEAVRISWLQATGADSNSITVDALCGMIYSLAVLREHRHPLMQLLTQQLAAALQLQPPAAAGAGAALAGGSGRALPLVGELLKHAPQLAAAMLAAQAEQQESPLVAVLPTDMRMQVIEVWRRKAAQRASKRPDGYLAYLIRVVTRMGIVHRVELTPDGIVCPDVTVSLPTAPGVRFTLELVGPHNTAANSGRLLGDAALKYRLLQARGYLVVPISCKDWDNLGSHDDKMMYVEAKLDKRVAALTSTNAAPGSPVAAATRTGAAFASLSSIDGGSAPVNVSARALPTRIEVAPRQPASDLEILKPSDNRPH